MLRTDYETYSEDNQKIKVELGGAEDMTLNRQLSLSRISQLNLRCIRNPSRLNLNTINAATKETDAAEEQKNEMVVKMGIIY